MHNSNGERQRFVVPIGPQHPALKEPGHFAFTVDGETVTDAELRLGYAHRGIEKATESRTWIQNLYLLERICGICSHIHAVAYCLGVEKLAEVEVPARAQAIRTIVAELERIHSHLLWLGVAAHEAGFDTLFMVSWRDREAVMEMLEAISGNRVHYSVNVLGGVKVDLTAAAAARIRSGLDYLEARTEHYLNLIHGDHLFRARTQGVGVMPFEEAQRLGVVGPTARASGLDRDLRVAAPYLAYDRHPPQVIRRREGDLQARFIVRLEELSASYRLIRQLLGSLPEGPLEVKRMPRRIKANETISRVEAPRGELFYFIQADGGDGPARIKVRTPTLCNMASVLSLTVGEQLADVPMILVGIDPCFSCNDRTVTLQQDPDGAGAPPKSWSWLRQYGIDVYRRRLQQGGKGAAP